MKALLAVLMVVVTSGCASNQFMVQRAQQSYEQQDYRQAFVRTLPAAKAGDAQAQYALGYMYFYGQGVVQDNSLSVHWLALSAAQGNEDAKKALSIIKKIK